jgi:hypothetical protein
MINHIHHQQKLISLFFCDCSWAVVNGQRAALHAPVFARKLEMTRSALMEDLMKDWGS